jgi:hypothetical protein
MYVIYITKITFTRNIIQKSPENASCMMIVMIYMLDFFCLYFSSRKIYICMQSFINPKLLFLLLAAICIGVRDAGYLFLLDDGLYQLNFSHAYEKFFQFNGAVLWILVDWINYLLPGRVTQRIIYIGTLFLLGLG